MRLTTKIVLGIILSVFLLTIIFTIYAAVAYKEIPLLDVKTLKYTSIDIPEYKAIRIELDSQTSEEDINKTGRQLQGNVYIHSIEKAGKWDSLPHPDAGRKDKMLIYEELKPFIRYSLENDTLTLYITPSKHLLKQWKNSANKPFWPSLIDILFFTDSSIDIQSIVSGIDINVVSADTEEMKINTTEGRIRISDCEANSISIEGVSARNYALNIKDSNIKRLDISPVNDSFDWDIINSKIDTANFRGFTDREISIFPNTFKKVNFIHKGREQPINIKMLSDSVQLIFP